MIMNKYLKYSLLVIAALFVVFGVYYFVEKSKNKTTHLHETAIYSCPMHPEIIRDEPGSCPICGMALVKKVSEKQAEESYSVEDLLQPADRFVAGNFQTTTAKDTMISSEVDLPGTLTYDSNSSVNITARVSGRIEKMYVNYAFQRVNKGQKLFDLYSPELLTEQQNFIYLISNDPENGTIIKAVKQKLLLYGMTNSQINSLIATKRTHPLISIYSPVSGVIGGTEKEELSGGDTMRKSETTNIPLLKEGDYITKNQVVFKLVNTNKVCGVFNLIQGFAGQIKVGQTIEITSEFNEKEPIQAKVNFIETQLNPAEKTNRIRVYLNNEKLQLPIGLRLQGHIAMHSIKGIWLEKQALVSLGTKKMVFLKEGNGFKATAVKTGIERNGFVQIIEGLMVTDEVAQNGQYMMDSESFIKTE